jgi:hypothetical protein
MCLYRSVAVFIFYFDDERGSFTAVAKAKSPMVGKLIESRKKSLERQQDENSSRTRAFVEKPKKDTFSTLLVVIGTTRRRGGIKRQQLL